MRRRSERINLTLAFFWPKDACVPNKMRMLIIDRYLVIGGIGGVKIGKIDYGYWIMNYELWIMDGGAGDPSMEFMLSKAKCSGQAQGRGAGLIKNEHTSQNKNPIPDLGHISTLVKTLNACQCIT